MEKTETTQAENKIEETPDLAAEAIAELMAERKANEEPEPKEAEPSAEKPAEKEAEPQEEAKPEEEPEEKATEEKAEPKTEEKPAEKEEESADDKIVNDWAVKHGMTVAEAREDLDKTRNVVKKYQTPEEMARALRIAQREYDKLKSTAEAKPEVDPYHIPANPRLEVFEHVRQNQAEIIEKYRQNYPARTRDMEDDAILEEVSDKLLQGYTGWVEQQTKKLSTDAGRRREELLSSLSEADRRFLPDVKAVLDKTSDKVVVSKNFNLQDVIWWAKGQQFDKAVKEVAEREYKRAKEEAKILGTVPSSRVDSSAPAKKGGIKLSDYEKKLAREMFATTTFSDEEKYEAYIDIAKKKKK